MSIWLLLWVVLSFVLLGATAWSTIILIQQKKAWEAYAKKKSLTFVKGQFFSPCTMEGVIDGYNVSFFSATQQNEDSRKNRELTVMQVNVSEPFVDGIAMGTKEMIPFLQTLDALMPHDIKTGKWNKDHYIRSRNIKAVDAYLTEERVKILGSILSMPNTDVLILVDNNEGVFRFETSNPLTDAKQIENTVDKLFARIKKLVPTKEEGEKLSALERADARERAESSLPDQDSAEKEESTSAETEPEQKQPAEEAEKSVEEVEKPVEETPVEEKQENKTEVQEAPTK